MEIVCMVSKDNDKLDLIYDLVKQNREEVVFFRREAREDSQANQQRLSNLEQQSVMQNQQLAEHMRRTNLLEELHTENQHRIEKLEEPKKVFMTLRRWFIGIGTMAGTIVAICKLFKLF